ncbi:MAG: hypothetical protein GKC04_09095 [Methanomicrobiales archaeon]|nr:hypothetical protein [Methanomicrobiales archaeon]
MSIGRVACLCILAAVLVLTAGCSSYAFGDVLYSDGTLSIGIENTGEPRQVTVQVTIFDTTGFSQQEIYKKAEYVDLRSGANEYLVSIDLSPGTYKLYLYVLVDDARTTTVIRDITIP